MDPVEAATAAELLQLDLQLDAAYVAHLVMHGPAGSVDEFVETSGFRLRLERWRALRAAGRI